MSARSLVTLKFNVERRAGFRLRQRRNFVVDKLRRTGMTQSAKIFGGRVMPNVAT